MAGEGHGVEVSVDPTPSIFVKCRPGRLLKLISQLNHAQREAVKRIGFGGLLDLRLKHVPVEHVHLFFETFNDLSHIFRASDSKEFLVSKFDVHDCFLLPLGHKPLDLVPTGRKKDPLLEENKQLKDRWRKSYKLSKPGKPIHLGKLLTDLEKDKEGGDQFCRLFVLFSMSSFLAPTTNNTVDMKLLGAVEDVGVINEYDWCSYVLDGVVSAAFAARKSPSCLRGCIPFLMITYFQRFDFRDEAPRYDLPLIKHWDDERIASRLKGELVGGCLGRQTWSSVTYPRTGVSYTHHSKVVDKQLPTTSSGTPLLMSGPSSRSTTDKKFIQIELPPGVEDDAELEARAVDGVHELYLKMQRNAIVFHAWYSDSTSKLKRLTTPHMDPTDIVPSQHTREFFEGDAVHRYVDEVIDISCRMKDSVGIAPVFHEESVRQDNEVDDRVLDRPSDLEEQNVDCPVEATGLEMVTSVLYSTAEMGEIARDISVDAAGRDVVAVAANDDDLLGTQTGGANSPVLEIWKAHKKGEVVDVSKEIFTSWDMWVEECIDPFRLDSDLIVSKNGKKRGSDSDTGPPEEKRPRLSDSEPKTPVATTAAHSKSIRSLSVVKCRPRGGGDGLGCTIDCGLADIAILVVAKPLRNNQYLYKDVTYLRKHTADYCFVDDIDCNPRECLADYGRNARLNRDDIMSMLPEVKTSSNVIECWSKLLNKMNQMNTKCPEWLSLDAVMRLKDSKDQSTPSNTQMDNLFMIWDIFIKGCGRSFNTNAELFFIPVNVDEHYACVCINFKTKTIDLLDNQYYPASKQSDIVDVTIIIAEVFSDYLESRNLGRDEEVPTFERRQIKLAWQGPKANVEQSAVFTMMHMLLYEGAPFSSEDLMRKITRRYLVIELAATLVLADMNKIRKDLLEKVNTFVDGKADLWKKLYAARKANKITSKK
ncbi:hypothetical protein KSS87_014382 [Heliosperma pusillum]|nr:hypothetical protein KSS87_014382 [Heliosperma pusillum]